ncbi:MAG TPA: 4'-phosphopantetheinyl transferase superfamily protein [Balneolaceae bacterium]|nr:4'-phosphopantetheinyl transferase superfamily protein [Balneolaceae bacterium]
MPDKLSDIVSQLPFKSSFGFNHIEPISEDALVHLQHHEVEELHAFANERRKREYLSSRILIKQLASEWSEPGDEFEILKDALGRPYGMHQSDRYFVSIAHTGNKVFCGISPEAAIGVDAEPVDRLIHERLKRRIVHPGETDELLSLETIRLWTIKEAFIKLEGQGLRLNMNQVEVRVSEPDFFVEINNDKRAKICSFQYKDHWLAIAYYQ